MRSPLSLPALVIAALLALVVVGCKPKPVEPTLEPAPAVEEQGTGLNAPIVFVSRPPQPDGSAHWPTSAGGPLEMPGLGPRARLRPATPGKLLVLEPNGQVRALVDGSKPTAASLRLVDVNAPSVSFDGAWVVFAGLREGIGSDAPHNLEGGTASVGGWRLYVIGSNGNGLRQLTFDEPERTEAAYVAHFGAEAGRALLPFDDFDPVFLPTGNVAFSSTRWPSFAHFADQRTSQLYVVTVDGGEPKRITSERNGADRAVVDPVSGDLVYARWWQNGHPPTNLATSVPAEGGGFEVHNGLKASAEVLPDEPDVAYPGEAGIRRSWHAARINPDGYGLAMFAGFERSDEHGHYYGGAFADDGTLYANWFPVANMTEAAGFGGVRRVERGAHKPVGLAGATGPRTDYVPDPGGERSQDPVGVVMSRFAVDPVVLPAEDSVRKRDGRLLLSMTASPGDLSQDYGLYVMDRAGGEPELLFDLPGTAELRAQVLAPRNAARIRNDIATGYYRELPPVSVPADPSNRQAAKVAVNGSFHFNPLNVYANAPVDVDIVSAIPVGSAKTLRAFADYQRGVAGTPGEQDWPILLAQVPIDAGGAASVQAPANVPLFEDVRDPAGRVAQTGGHYGAAARDVGPAFVAGMNFAPLGFHSRCVGCHAGHSLMEVPDDDDEARWSNLAPGARVSLSSVADEALRGAMEASVVDRKVRKADPARTWRTAPDATSGSATLQFPVPVWIRGVQLHELGAMGAAGIDGSVTAAQVRLFAGVDDAEPVAEGPVERVGGALRVSFVGSAQPAGVRRVVVELTGVAGQATGSPSFSLAALAATARGDKPAGDTIAAPPPPQSTKPLDYAAEGDPSAPALAVYDGQAAPEDGGRAPAAGCKPGQGSSVFGGEVPLPTDGPAVTMQGMELGEDGAIRLPGRRDSPRPRYSVIVEGDCDDCAWTQVALAWELPSRSAILTRVRAGATPKPDATWSAWTKSERARVKPLDPPPVGRYLEIDFTLTTAEREHSPALWGFTACWDRAEPAAP